MAKNIKKTESQYVVQVQGRWGTWHYEAIDKPKGDYQLKSMIPYVGDTVKEVEDGYKKRHALESQFFLAL